MKHIKLFEDYYSVNREYISVDSEDYESERSKVKYGETYEIEIDTEKEDYDDEGYLMGTYDDVETIDVIKTRTCEECDVRIAEESEMWQTSKSNGQIIISRDMSIMDDNDPDIEYCGIEEVNNFIIYDDGHLGWDETTGDLHDEIILYIYYFFDMDTVVRERFDSHHEEYIEDYIEDEEIEKFKIKYKDLILKKKIDEYDI